MNVHWNQRKSKHGNTPHSEVNQLKLILIVQQKPAHATVKKCCHHNWQLITASGCIWTMRHSMAFTKTPMANTCQWIYYCGLVRRIIRYINSSVNTQQYIRGFSQIRQRHATTYQKDMQRTAWAQIECHIWLLSVECSCSASLHQQVWATNLLNNIHSKTNTK